MNKIYNWILHWMYTKKLREIQDVPFKMKIETDSLKSNSILEIENEIEPLWLSIKSLLYKLSVKSIQNLRARIHRDDFGKQAITHNPVFSGNQIAEIKAKYSLFLFLLLGFCVAETFLYKLTASLFVAGGGEIMYLAVSLLFAVGVMYGLSFGFDTHFKYREVIERHGRKELTDTEVLKYRDMRNIGYFISFICISAIIFSGLARIYYLEYIPARGLSPERVASVTKASRMASVFSLLFTVLIAFIMAMIKRELSKVSNKYKVYKEWSAAHISQNDYAQGLIQNANRVIQVTEQCMEKNWQLVIDLKRVYKMETEYDSKYSTLDEEYVLLKAKPGFKVTDDIYSKFSSIQSGHEELFKYGVLNAKEIKDKIDFAREILKVPEDHIKEHLQSHPDRNIEEVIQLIPLHHTNGKVKEHDLFIHK